MDSSDKSGSRDGAAVSDSCRPGVDAVLRAEERVDGASDASLVVSLKDVLEVCEFGLSCRWVKMEMKCWKPMRG